jgi:ribosomal protein L29
MLNIQELRQLSDSDLKMEQDKSSKELLKIRMDLESGYAKASHKAKELKKYIARINTIQQENLTTK